MNKAHPSAEAVAVKDDRIIKVGSTEDISYLIGKNTQIIYLGGRTVIPGFIDTHIHVADFGRFLLWVDLTVARSINKMQVLLGEKLENAAKDKWVVGRGWNENQFAEKRLPTRFDLDVVSPHNPVIFYHQSGQTALVNTKALNSAGITKETDCPMGGIIDKDSTGEPTGVLREGATDLVWKLVPEPGLNELVDAASSGCERIVQAGITTVHWLAASATDILILRKLRASGKLPLKVYMVIPSNLLGDSVLPDHLQDGDVKIGGVEVTVDGYLASRTAALFSPYSEDPQNRGKLSQTQKVLNAMTKNVLDKGFQIVAHAMGDKAVDAALTAIEISEERGRQRIDPAALLNGKLIERIKKLKVVVSVQPLVAASEFSVYDAEEHLGKDRARWLYPLKTLFKEGIRVCGGSDCPMEPLNPLIGVQSAVTRRFFPEEQLTAEEALQMYTLNAAYASCEEKTKGSIEEGKFADLTVLSENPCEVSSGNIQDIQVEMTIINGKIVYSQKEPP